MRTVLVTGATSGVGQAAARALLSRGARVIAVGRRAERLEELKAANGALHTAVADLSQPGAAAAILAAAPPDWPITALIHAAGHDSGGAAPFHEGHQTDRAAKIAVNLTSFAELVHGLLPGWLELGRGDTVAIGSIASREPAVGLTDYGMTKYGLRGLLAGLRADYGATGLRFVEIVPGVIRTEFAASRWRGDAARSAAFYERFPECLTAEDVAESALWALDQPPHVAVDEIVLRPTRR